MGLVQVSKLPDATSGGTKADVYTTPANFTGARAIEVEGFDFKRNSTQIDRNSGIRGTRGSAPDAAFRWAPTIMMNGFAYLPQIKAELFHALGAASTSGSATAGYTTAITPIADSLFFGQAATIPFKRDNEPWRAGVGCLLNELTLTFGYEGAARWEATYVCNYVDESGSVPAAPTPDFSYLGSPELLFTGANGKLFEAGSGTLSAGIRGATIKFGPFYEDPDFDMGYCVKQVSIDGVATPIQFPTQYVLRAQRDITGTIDIRGLDQARAVRTELRRTRQLRLDYAGRPISGSTGPVNELLRFDLPNAGLTGIDEDAISRSDRPNTTLNFKAAVPQAGGPEITATVIDGTPGPLTVAG